MIRILLVIVLFLSVSGTLMSAIYKWVDDEGNVYYGDKSPTDYKPKQTETAPDFSEEGAQQVRENKEQFIHKQKQRELFWSNVTGHINER